MNLLHPMKKTYIFSLLILITVIGCDMPQQVNTSTKFEFEQANPEDEGLSPDSLQSVTDFLQRTVQQNMIPGAIAVISKDDKIVFKKAVGFADIEKEIELQDDHIFRLASMTKAVTSLAVVQLADRGSLSFDDLVSKYIPEFSNPEVLESVNWSDTTWTAVPANREVTIHDLLTHTSGIAYGFIDSTMNAIYQKSDVPDGIVMDDRNIAETMHILGTLPLKHQPGEAFTYGLSTDVLGRVIEVASGLSVAEYFEKNIFDPLGMDDTHFYLPEKSRGRLVPLYRNPDPNDLEKMGRDTEFGEAAGFPLRQNGTYYSGGAGLSGTATDYVRFMNAIMNKGKLGESRILSEEMAEYFFENRVGDIRLGKDGFSYGFMVTLEDGQLDFGRNPGRLSWGGLFQTSYWMDPQQDMAVVLMTQVYPSAHQDELYQTFENKVNAAVYD